MALMMALVGNHNDRAASYMILDVVSKGIGDVIFICTSKSKKQEKIDDIERCMTR